MKTIRILILLCTTTSSTGLVASLDHYREMGVNFGKEESKNAYTQISKTSSDDIK